MEERKDSFDVWETQWKIFIELSTIKDLVPGPQQPKYMATFLLSCMSPNTLKTVVKAGLGATAMDDVTQIIDYPRERDAMPGRTNAFGANNSSLARNDRGSKSTTGYVNCAT